MHWKNVAIVGVGLIGASIGLGLLQRKLAGCVVGIGRDATRLRLARDQGALSEYTTSLPQGVARADLIVVCTPVDSIASYVLQAAQHCPAECLITDVGSTKQHPVEQIERQWTPESHGVFVGSHPVAGSEKSGAAAGRADLFQDRLVIVTPTARTPRQAVERLGGFWQSLGARLAEQSPAEHDRILAATSHVPHVIASALAAMTDEHELAFTAGGWADTTRVAAGDADLWRQILFDNRTYVLKSLDKFAKVLAEFRTALADEDARQLEQLLAAGKKRRDALGS